MNRTVGNYFLECCGRCILGGTPDCKVHRWIPELEMLRAIVLDCGLSEECKWGVPCYTFQNNNVFIISAFKNHCAISFFKGSLIKDAGGMLEKPGEHSQATRLIKFTAIQQIEESAELIKALVFNAIEIEKAGLKVNFKKDLEPIPEELEHKFLEDPMLKDAFNALTPGRQRGYILFISAPKQSKTRISRIEKCIGKILNGEGMHDKYKRRK